MFNTNMIRVFGLILFVLVIFLGILAGCNGGGGKVAPCADIDDECPCIFSEVPVNPQCWPATPPESRTIIFFSNTVECSLDQNVNPTPPPFNLSMLSNTIGTTTCHVCREANREEVFLTQGQFEACQCKLEQYVKELIELGITVVDELSLKPLKPKDVSCQTALDLTDVEENVKTLLETNMCPLCDLHGANLSGVLRPLTQSAMSLT